MTRAALALLLALAIAGCTQYPVTLNPSPEPGPRIVDFSRRAVWPIDVELPDPSYVAVFSIGQNLSMQHPLVPVSRLERIYGAPVEISNNRVVAFRSRHPYPHPDSVPDPFLVSGPRLPAGSQEIQRPYAPYIIRDLTYSLPCTYYLLIASYTPLDLGGIFDLEWRMLPRSPREIAAEVIEALGLETGTPGWGAQLEQGRCERRE